MAPLSIEEQYRCPEYLLKLQLKVSQWLDYWAGKLPPGAEEALRLNIGQTQYFPGNIPPTGLVIYCRYPGCENHVTLPFADDLKHEVLVTPLRGWDANAQLCPEHAPR